MSNLDVSCAQVHTSLLLTCHSADPPVKDSSKEHEASHPRTQHARPPHQLAQQGSRRHGQVARSYQTAGPAVQHQRPGNRQHTQTAAIGHWGFKTGFKEEVRKKKTYLVLFRHRLQQLCHKKRHIKPIIHAKVSLPGDMMPTSVDTTT